MHVLHNTAVGVHKSAVVCMYTAATAPPQNSHIKLSAAYIRLRCYKYIIIVYYYYNNIKLYINIKYRSEDRVI
jgi:hypothetical protein